MNAHGEWSFYSMPGGSRFYPYSANSFCMSPDGTLVITGCGGNMVLFDPVEETFETKRHPEGRNLKCLFPRKGGGLWIATRGSYAAEDYYLEIYDWENYKIFFEVGNELGRGEIRDLYEDSNGSLWLGGSWPDKPGVGIYTDGKYQALETECPDPCNCIYAVDDSTLWIGSGDRIVAYDGNRWTTVRSRFR